MRTQSGGFSSIELLISTAIVTGSAALFSEIALSAEEEAGNWELGKLARHAPAKAPPRHPVLRKARLATAGLLCCMGSA